MCTHVKNVGSGAGVVPRVVVVQMCLLGWDRKMDQKKKHGPVWFTLNSAVKIHRETQKMRKN